MPVDEIEVNRMNQSTHKQRNRQINYACLALLGVLVILIFCVFRFQIFYHEPWWSFTVIIIILCIPVLYPILAIINTFLAIIYMKRYRKFGYLL